MDIRSFFGGKKNQAHEQLSKQTEIASDQRDVDTEKKSVSEQVISTLAAETRKGTEINQPQLETPAIGPQVTAVSEPIPKEIADIIDWKPGDSVPYNAVAEAFEKIGATSGRLEKESILCRYFAVLFIQFPV